MTGAAPFAASSWPPPFSEHYVAQARELLDRAGAIVFEGPLDGSCSRLATAVAQGPAGPPRAEHTCRYGEQDQAHLLLRMLFTSISSRGGLPSSEVERAVRTELADVPDAVVVVGNAHLADRPSVEILARLAAAGLLKVVTTVPTHAVDAAWPLLGVAERVTIPPLDLTTVSELLTARFGYRPHRQVAELILDRTGGTYGMLQELTDAAFEAGVLVPLEDSLVIAPTHADRGADLLDDVMARPSSAPHVTHDDLLELIALVGAVDAREAVAVLGHETVDRAVVRGVVRLQDGHLTLTSPAESRLVARTIPSERRVTLFDTYAARMPHSLAREGVAVDVADWCLAAGHRLPVDLAARAAREANLTGRHRRAVTLTDPAHVVDAVVPAPLERLFALVEVGDGPAADALLGTLDPAGLDEDELLPYLRWLNRLAPSPDRTHREQRALVGDDADEQRRRAAVKSLADLFDRVFHESTDELETRLRALAFSGQLCRTNQAVAFSALSAVQRMQGRPDPAVLSARHALELLAAGPCLPSAFHLTLAQELLVLALVSALDLPAAEAALHDYALGPLRQPGSGRLALALGCLLGLVRGDVHQAYVDARLCIGVLSRHDPHRLRGWVEAMLAQTLVALDRAEEAEALLQSSAEHPAPLAQAELERQIWIACTRDGLGEPERALEDLTEVRLQGAQRGLLLTEIEAAARLVQVGGPVMLPALVRAVDGLVDPTGTPAYCRTFALAAQAYDFPALVELVEDLSDRGAHLYAAWVAQYVLDSARRRSDLDPETRARLVDYCDPTDRAPRPALS
jgi:hypothetical protein